MYRVGLVLIAIAGLVLTVRASGREDTQAAATSAVPVMIELFTSEGCSSCPPADALLRKLDTQPFPGGHIIVLSEHVDYWNHIGWTDPYSSHASSERQSAYGMRFNLDSVYTPQMIVDGSDEFVGNDLTAVQNAFDKAIRREKIPLRLSGVAVDGHPLRAHVDGDVLHEARHADSFLIVALDHAASEVSRGENAGRHLTHVAVVRSLT